MVLETIGELVDEPRISVEIEDDGLVRREQAVEVARRRPVRMFGRRDQLEQIDDVDEAQLQVRQPFAEDRGGRKRLLCGHVTTARQDGIGLFSGVGAGPGPDAEPLPQWMIASSMVVNCSASACPRR